MKVTAFELGPFLARTLVVEAEGSDSAILVDPGFEVQGLLEELARRCLRVKAIVLTHAHIDHAYGAAEAKAAFPAAPLLLHRDDLPLFRNLAAQATVFGFPPPEPVAEDGFLADGDTVAVGEERLLVRHAPGHSPGHVVLISHDSHPPLALVGDVLFAGSIGRTDLWGGSLETLERSIRQVLYTLPGATRIIPGHGEDTTVAQEMATNPFVPAR
ncbi:MAG: MBL fold metallo-hydrolase [Thermoanaerobaculaceae bacterium]|nr:MBL fold metallo-hydrolase [Thermoanaerobaculaceae bacterium]